tara:strand:+ start:735 stop:1379 length:645 start_codon:yes stop_codon:yes gene_type:complete
MAINNNINKELPELIPVFPLEGVVMFPDTYLPLNIFETRYIEMINKAISSKSRLVGMIQPNNSEQNKLYDVGCAGRIIKFEETGDKRYLITLKGLSRFELISEKTNGKKFKEAQIKWDRYSQDLKKQNINEKFTSLKSSLKKYFKIKNIKVNFEVINNCNDYNFVDQITMICPLAFEEKQLLLETISISKRGDLLQSIIESYATEENISQIVKH